MTDPDSTTTKRKAGQIVLAAIGGSLFLVMLYNVNSTPTSPVVAAETTVSAPAAAAETSAPDEATAASDTAPADLGLPSLQPGDRIIRQLTGAGSTTTRPIVVTGAWELQWAYADQGSIAVHTANGESFDSHYVPDGARAGTAYEAAKGRFSIVVNTDAAWAVRLVAVSR